MNTEKMSMKDIITVTLLTLINIAIFFGCSVFYMTPITILLIPILFGILESFVFFAIGYKVQKKGALLIYCLIHGAVGGYLPYFISFAVAGIICEVIMARTGYGNDKGLSISFVLSEIFGAFGGVYYPFVIAYETFFKENAEAMKEGQGKNSFEAAQILHSSWVWAFAVGVIITAVIGAFIAKKAMRKHNIRKNSEA